MTVFLLVGYIPLMLLLLGISLCVSGLRRDGEAQRALGDHVGRRSGLDRRRAGEMPYVGTDRRTGVDRRGLGAGEGQADRAA
jgi:hypothetical protein